MKAITCSTAAATIMVPLNKNRTNPQKLKSLRKEKTTRLMNHTRATNPRLTLSR